MSAQPLDPATAAAAPTTGPDLAFELVPMQLSDVAEVAAIEKAIYTAPWTQGNFVDSLTAGYCAWTLRAIVRPTIFPPAELVRQPVVGYFILMAAADEAHLLNLSIASHWQKRGLGLRLLRKATLLAADCRASSVILEVRPSNGRALAVYRRFGFRDHGLRRRYYPVSDVDPQAREDAIVMRLQL